MIPSRSLFCLATAVALVSCTKKPGPGDILRQYTDATLHGRVEEAWPLLCEKDRAYRSLSALKEAAKDLESTNAKTIVEKTRFEIAGIEIDGDHAKVTERFTGPNVGRIISLAEADPLNAEKVKSLPPDKAMEFGQELLAQALAKPDCPVSVTDQTINLVRERGDWKVVADFEAHDHREQAKDPVVRDLQGKPPE